MIVKGRLASNQSDSNFTGYRLAAIFQKKIKAEITTEAIYPFFEINAQVTDKGAFQVDLPNAEEIKDSITFRVQAPNGEQLAEKQYSKSEIDDAEIVIDVECKIPFRISRAPSPHKPKIEGKVLDFFGVTKITEKQVLIWARDLGSQKKEFRVVIDTVTDENAKFYEEMPVSEYEAAYATIQDYPEEKIPIILESRRLPKKLILVVNDEANKNTGCDCGDPDCTCCGDDETVDFTTPNRTLEEFNYYSIVRTTDPAIRGLTLDEPSQLSLSKIAGFLDAKALSEAVNPTARSAAGAPSKKAGALDINMLKDVITSDPNGFTPTELSNIEKLSALKNIGSMLDFLTKKWPFRGPLNADNPVDWDAEPTFYQATTIAHGHILHLKQSWKADGYSIGDLLYSLPLAPRQKKQIAMVDWDRSESAARSESASESEYIEAAIARDRDISEVTSGVIEENMRAGSKSSTWSAGGGFGLSLGKLVIGASGGGGGASSSAWQDSSRSMSSNFLNQLRDQTVQSAASVRSQRTTVVQSVKQGETITATTEVVGNPNHCHAITMEYFEVLRHFQVTQELADVQECLFVPLLMSRFDLDKALRWRDALQSSLRNRALAKAFDALERIKNNYEGSDLPMGRYSEENIEYLDGELRISFKLVRPKDNSDGNFEGSSWEDYAPYLWDEAQNIWDLLLALKDKSTRDRIFYKEIAPRIAEEFVKQLRFYVKSKTSLTEVKLDATLVSEYTANKPLLVTLRPGGNLPEIPREQITSFLISTDCGLGKDSKTIVTSASVRYRTQHLNKYLFRDAAPNNDLTSEDSVVIGTPMSSDEMRNPRNEDQELKKRILAHLNEHIEYYHRAIWLNMDPNRRYMLLDGFVAPNSNGRSVASVVENRVIGVVGNCLVLPVARGFNLDPTYQSVVPVIDEDGNVVLDEHGEIVYEYKSLLDLYQPVTPIPPMRISVPTKGLFAEAVMGKCNSCETIDLDRSWVLNDPTFDQIPTAINPVSTDSRKTDAGDLTAKDFPTPMINIQNSPAAPDPSGSSAIMNLLGKSNMFKDITGLEGNQFNALAAYQSALSASQSFANTAGVLQQGMVLDNMDTLRKGIVQARKDGLINKDQATELMKNVFEGASGKTKEETKKHLVENPVIEKMIKTGVQMGKDIAVNTPDGDKIEVKESKSGRVSNNSVSYIVPDIKYCKDFVDEQLSWAAGAATLMAYRDTIDYTVQEAVELMGADWRALLNSKEALSWDKRQDFASATQLILESLMTDGPESYVADDIQVQLKLNGPIAVLYKDNSNQAGMIIITGIRGDGTDPGTYMLYNIPYNGQSNMLPVNEFRQAFEYTNADGKNALDILHIP